jgi:hypothetical protein
MDEWRLSFILFPIHLLMKLFIGLIFFYFIVIFEHHYRILAINSNNISGMNTSREITINRMSHTNSFIILSFCIFSSILLCLYAIYHNRQSIPMSYMFKQKINRKSSPMDIQQSLEGNKDILTINDSDSSGPSMIIQQTSPLSLKTNSSNQSNTSF